MRTLIEKTPLTTMKSILAILCLVIAPFVGANGSSVTFGTAVSNILGDKDGNLAPTSVTVGLGYFVDPGNPLMTLNDAQIAAYAAAGDAANLSLSFQAYSSALVGTGYALPGAWTSTPANLAPAFVGKQVYYFAYDTGAIATATQWGIFTAPTNPNWVFPANPVVPLAVVTDLSEVPTGSSGILAGSFGPETDGGGYFANTTPGNGVPLYKMTAVSPVPEPTTFASGAMLALVAISVRRRRRG